MTWHSLFIPLRKCLKDAKYAFKYAPSMDFQVWFVSNADFKMQTWFECILKFAYLKKCILDFAYLESSMLKSAFETNHTWKCILDFPGGVLTLTTDGDVPLEFEKWTLSDTNFWQNSYPTRRNLGEIFLSVRNLIQKMKWNQIQP